MSLARDLAAIAQETNSPKFSEVHKSKFVELARKAAEQGSELVSIGKHSERDLYTVLVTAQGLDYLRSEEFILEQPGSSLLCYFNKQGQWDAPAQPEAPVTNAPVTNAPIAVDEPAVNAPVTNAPITNAVIENSELIPAGDTTNVPAIEGPIDIVIDDGNLPEIGEEVTLNNQPLVVTNVIPSNNSVTLEPVSNDAVIEEPAPAPVTNVPADVVSEPIAVGEPVLVNNVPSIVTEVLEDGSLTVEPIAEEEIDTVIADTDGVESVEDLPVLNVPVNAPVTDLEGSAPVTNNATDLSSEESAPGNAIPSEGVSNSPSNASSTEDLSEDEDLETPAVEETDDESLEGIEVELPSDESIPATSPAEEPVLSQEEDTVESPIAADEPAPTRGASRLKDRKRK